MNNLSKKIAKLLSLTVFMTAMPIQTFSMEPTYNSLDTVTSMRETTKGEDLEITTGGAIQIETRNYVGDGYHINFKVKEKRDGIFTGEIILENTDTIEFKEWRLKLNLSHNIMMIDGAEIIEFKEGYYTFKGIEEARDILPGEQITIIFDAEYDEQINTPTMCELEEYIDLDIYPEDEERYRIWKKGIKRKLERAYNNTDSNSRIDRVAEATTGYISNEYVKFNYIHGQYGLFTTGGNPENPNDDNKNLLFGSGGTSYTTIRINGVDHRFTPDTVKRYDNKIIGTKQYGDIVVSQHIGIISNQYTNREDVVEFFYTVENLSDTPHNVGVRIMFDTQLGNNDHAPFRLPTTGDIASETDLRGEYIPEFWQAFDSLTNPSIVAQGTLNIDKASTPDRVRFTNWGAATGNPWDYYRAEGSYNGDSAVCLYWEEELVTKEDVLSCKTYYGLSALQQDLRPPLAVALTGATKLEVIENKDGKEEYSPNPFTVTAYIQNIGTGAAVNSEVKINLPKGMEIIEGTELVELGDIPVGTKQHQVSWKVKVHPSSVDKVEKYSVSVIADNADEKVLEREITIPAIEMNLVKVEVEKNLLLYNDTLKMKITNVSNSSIDTQTLFAKYYYNYEVNGELRGICNNVFVNGKWLSGGNRNIVITNEKTGFIHNASGALNIGLQNLGVVLEPNEELELEIELKRSNNWALEHIKNYSSDTVNDGVSVGRYMEWDTINVLNNNELLWGVVPQEAEGIALTGIACTDSSVEQKIDGLAPVLYFDLAERDNELVFQGKVMLDNRAIEIDSKGKGYYSESLLDMNTGKSFYTFDEQQKYEILAFNIIKNPQEINILTNPELIGNEIIQIIIRDTDNHLIYIFEEELDEKLGIEVDKIKTSSCDEQLWQENELWYEDFSKPKTQLSDAMMQWYKDLLAVKLLQYKNPSSLFTDDKLEVSKKLGDRWEWVSLDDIDSAFVPKEIFQDTTNLSGKVILGPWGGEYIPEQLPYSKNGIGVVFVKYIQPVYYGDGTGRYQRIDIFSWANDPEMYQFGVKVFENQGYLYDTKTKKVSLSHPNYTAPFKADDVTVRLILNPHSAAYFSEFTTKVCLTDNKNSINTISTGRIAVSGYKDIMSLIPKPKVKAVNPITWISLLFNSIAFLEQITVVNNEFKVTDNTVILGGIDTQIADFKEVTQRFSISPPKGYLKEKGDYFMIEPEIHHYKEDGKTYRPNEKDLGYAYSFILKGVNAKEQFISSCTFKNCNACKKSDTMLLDHFIMDRAPVKHYHEDSVSIEECKTCRIETR